MAQSRIDSRAGIRGRVAWVGLGALLLAILGMWSLAMPLMASPDEGSHVVKAAAVARGQWSGPLGPPPEDTSRPGAATVVEIPNDIAQTLLLPNCYAFQPDSSADCVPDLPDRSGAPVPVETFAGQYPPLYYLLVGWPSLLLTGEAAVYGMRLASALVSVVMLTWGAVRLRAALPPALAAWGGVVALTPMCLFLAGTVNPNGWEIATAFSFWTACLAVAVGRGPITTGTLVHVAVTGALLVNIRDSSPFWALAIVVVAAVMAPRGRIRELVRHRLAPWVAGVAVVSGVAMAAWAATHGGAVSARGLHPRFADPSVAVLEISGSTYNYLQQMIGNFGWLDTPSPPVTFLGWYAALGAIVLLAFAATTGLRARLGLALVLLGVALAPFLQLPTAPDAGLIWQGRYALPLAVGVALVAAASIATASRATGRSGASAAAAGGDPAGRGRPVSPLADGDVARRMFRVTLPVVVVAQVAAFYWALRRYSEGATGELITGAPDWDSPVGYLTGAAGYAVLWLVLAVACRRVARTPRVEPAPATPAVADVPSAT